VGRLQCHVAIGMRNGGGEIRGHPAILAEG
jgi:hypothetical protein